MTVAVTVASFKAAFPAFRGAGDTMLAAQLAMAELTVSDSFGAHRDEMVMLRLAMMLEAMPEGRDARTVAPDGSGPTSTYAVRFAELAQANAVSASRLGSRI